MDLERLEDIAVGQMACSKAQPARETGYILYHGRRVGRLCRNLAEQLEAPLHVSDDLLYAAGLFHDVGKGREPHHTIGATMLAQLLRDIVPDDELSDLTDLVAKHNQRNQPSAHSLATQILQDADVLDHFGAQNVWIVLNESARDEASVAETLRAYAAKFDLDHLSDIRGLLNLEASRVEFDRRIAQQSRFFAQLAQEEQGDLFADQPRQDDQSLDLPLR